MMKFTIVLSLIALAASAPTTFTGRYIIKLRPSATVGTLRSLIQAHNAEFATTSAIQHEYSLIHAVTGTLDTRLAQKLASTQHVEYIVPDSVMKSDSNDDTQDHPPSWGLSRISQRSHPDLSLPYVYPKEAGAGVDVYIVDTGIYLDDEFQGRAKVIKSYITNETTIDMNGQGTAMAALIGGKTYGVAKKANLVGIKALNQQGIGMVADLIKGIELAAADFVLGRSAPRVLVLAFGGAKSQPIDDAVNAAAKKGVVTIAVSGSSSADACNFSPARATGVFTVGASDRFDRVLSNSNRGKCISMFAPGRDITTMWRGAEQRVVSGSSIAAAHAAGVAALYLSMNPSYASAQEVYNRMVYGSTRDVLQGLDSTTPNRLLFNGRGQ